MTGDSTRLAPRVMTICPPPAVSAAGAASVQPPLTPGGENMVWTVTAGGGGAGGAGGQRMGGRVRGGWAAGVAEKGAGCGNVPGRAVAPRPVTFHPHGAPPPAPGDTFGINSDGPLQVRNVVVPAVMIFRT